MTPEQQIATIAEQAGLCVTVHRCSPRGQAVRDRPAEVYEELKSWYHARSVPRDDVHARSVRWWLDVIRNDIGMSVGSVDAQEGIRRFRGWLSMLR